MSWGKGWEVGARKAIWAQQKARERAAEILAQEHGTGHEIGSRPDLCWKCQAEQQKSGGSGQGDV